MSDLWKALGDVYGDHETGRDRAATERPSEQPAPTFQTPLPLDDDLAAALSAALVNAPPTVGSTPAVTPVPAPAPPPAAAPVAFSAPAPGAAAPVPSSTPAAAKAPAETADLPPVATGQAQGKVVSWLAEVEERQGLRAKGPDLDAALPEGPTWARVDDDILPTTKGKSRGKGRRH